MKNVILSIASVSLALDLIGAASVSYPAATNIADKVTRQVVTKQYVEDLGISGGGADPNAVKALIESETGGTNSIVHTSQLAAKQNALTPAQTNAVDSGITAGKVSAYDGYAAQISAKYTKPSGGIPSSDIASGVIPDTSTLATKTELGGVQNNIREIIADLSGSNVVIAVTNYYGNTSGEIPTASIKELYPEVVNGVTNWKYRVVWSEKTYVTNMESRVIGNVTSTIASFEHSIVTNMSVNLAKKADKAWGKYTSSGGDAPPGSVYMTAPQTIFAGGMEFERVMCGEGSIGVLVDKGQPVYTAGSEGSFRFQDATGENFFGFNRTDSYTIGCDTDGIIVQNIAGSQMVTLTYNVTMSGVPIIYYSPNVQETLANWEQLNDSSGNPISGASVAVSWEQNPPADTELCYINCSTNAHGYFYAKIEVAGSAKFETNMPVDFPGGILASNETLNVTQKVYPVIVSGAVQWRVKQ